MIFAIGNSRSNSDYEFPDNINAIQSPILYYRLRSVNNQGTIQYSEIRTVRLTKAVENTVTLNTFPNPVTNDVTVSLPSAWQQKKVLFELFTSNGLQVTKYEVASGNLTENIDMSKMRGGVYVIKATCEGNTAQQRIVK